MLEANDTGQASVLEEMMIPPLRIADEHITNPVAIKQEISSLALLHEKAVLQDQLSTVIATVKGAFYSFLMRPDGSTAVPFATPRLYDFFNLSPEIMQRDASCLFAMIHPDDRCVVEESVAQSFRQLTLWHQEFRLCHPHRGDVWVEANSLPERQQDGSVLWHGFVLDVTERKHFESQFRQSQRMESIGRLAGGVAHDFNNMISIAIGYCDVIAKTMPPSDPNLCRLAKIKDAAYRAAALTRQLLTFSRRQTLQPVVMNLSEHIARFAEMLPHLVGKDIQVTLSLEQKPWSVSADPSQLDQVLMNLAINAGDAMPSGGKLMIETSNVNLTDSDAASHPEVKPGPYVMVCISDTGVGLSSEITPRIFEPFFTTKDARRATGLGLSTAYGIVKQSGGFIGVCSEVGVGTTFRVYLPSVSELPKIAPVQRSFRTEPVTPKTILLVEDEPTLREITTLLLQELGYRVLATSDGEEAIRVANDGVGPIDLLLTDVVMPGMNGGQLANRLRSKIPKLLLVSGYGDERVFREGYPAFGTYFMQKPLTKRNLESKLHAIFAT